MRWRKRERERERERLRESTLPPYLSWKDRVSCNAYSNSVIDHLVDLVRKEAGPNSVSLGQSSCSQVASAKELGAVSKEYVTPTSNHGTLREEEGF